MAIRVVGMKNKQKEERMSKNRIVELGIQDGDVLLIQTDAPISVEAKARIEASIQANVIDHLQLTGVKLIVGHGTSLAVIRNTSTGS